MQGLFIKPLMTKGLLFIASLSLGGMRDCFTLPSIGTPPPPMKREIESTFAHKKELKEKTQAFFDARFQLCQVGKVKIRDERFTLIQNGANRELLGFLRLGWEINFSPLKPTDVDSGVLAIANISLVAQKDSSGQPLLDEHGEPLDVTYQKFNYADHVWEKDFQPDALSAYPNSFNVIWREGEEPDFSAPFLPITPTCEEIQASISEIKRLKNYPLSTPQEKKKYLLKLYQTAKPPDEPGDEKENRKKEKKAESKKSSNTPKPAPDSERAVNGFIQNHAQLGFVRCEESYYAGIQKDAIGDPDDYGRDDALAIIELKKLKTRVLGDSDVNDTNLLVSIESPEAQIYYWKRPTGSVRSFTGNPQKVSPDGDNPLQIYATWSNNHWTAKQWIIQETAFVTPIKLTCADVKKRGLIAEEDGDVTPPSIPKPSPSPQYIENKSTAMLDIDPGTGLIADPVSCPIIRAKTFVAGQEPRKRCGPAYHSSNKRITP